MSALSRAADVAARGFSAKLDKWWAHFAAALAIRGRETRATGHGAEVTAHASGRDPVDTANTAIRRDGIAAIVDHAVKVGASK